MDTTTEIKHIDHLGLVAAVCNVGSLNDGLIAYSTKIQKEVK